MAKLKKKGRPELKGKDKRTPVGVPLKPAERKALQIAADAEDRPLAIFMRRVLLAHIKYVE